MKLEDYGIPALMLLIVAFIVLYGVALYQDGVRWEEFKVAHKCKVVGRMRGDLLTTVVPNSNGGVGVGVTATPEKTGWLCDDGVTYWR